jgi:hypothetical protein
MPATIKSGNRLADDLRFRRCRKGYLFKLIPQTKNFSHAGTTPPTVVFGGIGGEYGADGTLGAITGWKRR